MRPQRMLMLPVSLLLVCSPIGCGDSVRDQKAKPFVGLILLVETDAEFQPLIKKLNAHKEEVVSLLQEELNQSVPPDAKPEARNTLWQRQANAAVCLLELGEATKVWPLLRHSPDPSLRSHLIHRMAQLGADFQRLADRLDSEKDVSIRRALILALGEYDESAISASQRQTMVDKLSVLYRDDPDPGVHSAAAWTLRQWKAEDTVKRIDTETQKLPLSEQKKRQWYVNSQGQTFIVVNGPFEFDMGEKTKRTKTKLSHSFAIASCEVTVKQFQQFRADHRYDGAYAPQLSCPVNRVTWYDAAAYCNWLNEQENIPRGQWCYEPNEEGEYAGGMKVPADYLQRTGYRLPTEAEWEYACRANTTTAYSFGEPVGLLNHYAWYIDNSPSRSRPVGMKEPNDIGGFDFHGNAWEWCHDLYRTATEDTENMQVVQDTNSRVLRGGSFFTPSVLVRSAYRTYDQPDYPLLYDGFRPARTYP